MAHTDTNMVRCGTGHRILHCYVATAPPVLLSLCACYFVPLSHFIPNDRIFEAAEMAFLVKHSATMYTLVFTVPPDMCLFVVMCTSVPYRISSSTCSVAIHLAYTQAVARF